MVEISIELLNDYVATGLLKVQQHPSLDLAIYNYTAKVQYQNLWDELTLQARGLIVEQATGQIVGRPFRKFFNWEEGKHIETESFDVFKKMDGSLGILYHFDGEWRHASRGSFCSEQAEFFRQIWCQKYAKYEIQLNPEYTYLWEIIHPENQIVVDYGDMCDVILLSSIHTRTAIEDLTVLHHLSDVFNVVEHHIVQTSLEELKQLNLSNAEGFVVRFSNGSRCKVKFAEYIQLHSLMTELSTLDVWRQLKDGNEIPEHILVRIPDEIYQVLQAYEQQLRLQYQQVLAVHQQCLMYIGGLESRKEQAQQIRKIQIDGVYPKILFALLDNRSVDEMIWFHIRPEHRKLV